MTSDPSNRIEGDVHGDVVGGDKTVTQTAGGDIVGGDKITHSGTGHIFAGSGSVLVVQPQLSPASARDRANLLLLLNKVKTFWIAGVLERSVHTAFLLELGRELHTDAIDHPWASVLELPDAATRPLPANVSDIQVFDEAGRALLILGAPGAGKTTTLLEITRNLLARAEADDTQPIPVVFNLAGWEMRRQGLSAWLVAELSTRYQVPPALGRAWLGAQRLLPLLDGLDEVERASQVACVRAINQFSGQGLPGLIVCSRSEEYARLPVRLRLNAALCVNPLTPPQIDAYLQAGGPRLDALRSLVQADDALAILAQTPLFLSIMCLAYQDLEPAALSGPALTTIEQRQRHLLDQYVASMLKRKGQKPRLQSGTSLVRWLSWLAGQMAAHHQSVYLIERMQPSWLGSGAARWLYALLTRAVAWTILGFVLALALVAFTLVVVPVANSLSEYFALIFTLDNILNALDLAWRLAGRFTLTGLAAGLICGARFTLATRRPSSTRSMFVRKSLNWLSGSLLPPALVLLPRLGRSIALAGPSLLIQVIVLALFELPAIVLSTIAFRTWASGDDPAQDIARVDALSWSWVQSGRGALLGFAGSAMLGSACSLAFLDGPSPLNFAIACFSTAVPFGLFGAAVVGLVAGLRARVLQATPESGGWVARMARFAVAAGLAVGLGTGIFAFLISGVFAVIARLIGALSVSWVVSSIGVGLISLVVFGTVATFYYGGFGLLQHAVLRLLLIGQRRIPWNVARLANQAEDFVFLRQVGGGYIFIHRLVQDYFASLATR